jgi:nitrogen regulatory protein PII
MQAMVRPWRLAGVVTALGKRGIRGATVTHVSGIGFQGGVHLSPSPC